MPPLSDCAASSLAKVRGDWLPRSEWQARSPLTAQYNWWPARSRSRWEMDALRLAAKDLNLVTCRSLFSLQLATGVFVAWRVLITGQEKLEGWETPGLDVNLNDVVLLGHVRNVRVAMEILIQKIWLHRPASMCSKMVWIVRTHDWRDVTTYIRLGDKSRGRIFWGASHQEEDSYWRWHPAWLHCLGCCLSGSMAKLLTNLRSRMTAWWAERIDKSTPASVRNAWPIRPSGP